MADEKYRLTLEGSEIDEALLRLANYEDEGLVLGSRKGVMLGPGSEYYHKNARYYAELAQSAVPGDTTSAVRWDIDQSALTDADRELARKNIRAGGTNPNLLDNPFFTVRQRGNGPFTSGYNVDRWVSTSNATVTLNASGTLTWTTNDTYREFKQKLDNPTYYANGTYTVSVNIVGGTTFPWLIVYDGNGIELLRKSLTLGINTATITTGASGIGQFGLFNLTRTNVDAELKAVKLEPGSVSTLANDVPPDYGTELIKCRGYFERIHTLGSSEVVGMGVGASSSSVRIGVPSLICHNIKTVTYSGAGLLLEGNGTYLSISSINKLNNTPKNGFLTLTIGASGTVTPYQAYALVGTAAGGYIDISADI